MDLKDRQTTNRGCDFFTYTRRLDHIARLAYEFNRIEFCFFFYSNAKSIMFKCSRSSQYASRQMNCKKYVVLGP